MHVILVYIKWKCTFVFIDNVIIFSKSMEEDVKYIKEVLRLLTAAELPLKLKMCFFSNQ